MTFHALTEYLKYLCRAKGRHGTHSPFVYALVENVLQKLPETLADSTYELPVKDNQLITALRAYYGYEQVIVMNSSMPEVQKADSIIITDIAEPEARIGEILANLSDGSIVIVPGIHKTKQDSDAWSRICSMPDIKMCIDLYTTGLIISRSEFREKQHFVLKY